MIYSTVLRLKTLKSNVDIDVSGFHILAFFLNLIERANPKLSEELHKDTSAKPFSLSQLQSVNGKRRLSSIKEGEDVLLRITYLDERIFTYLADAVWHLSPKTELILGNIKVQCCDLLFSPNGNPYVDCTTFKDLYNNAGNETSICMEFLSPTTFRSSGRGERNILFPEPRLVFESLLNKWNAYTDDDLKLHLPEIGNDTIKVNNYRLTTNTIDFGKYQETGFLGKATFKFDSILFEEYIKDYNALADFAFYCGIGAKTTMGMGQARRVNIK